MALFRKKQPVYVPPGERLPLRDPKRDYVIYPTGPFVSNSFPRAGDGLDFLDGKVRPALCERHEIPDTSFRIAQDLLSFHGRQHTPLNAGWTTSLFAQLLEQNISSFYPEHANAVREWCDTNGTIFEPLRSYFEGVPRGLDLLDFEIIRVIATLADEQSSPILRYPPDETQPTDPEEIGRLLFGGDS